MSEGDYLVNVDHIRRQREWPWEKDLIITKWNTVECWEESVKFEKKNKPGLVTGFTHF